MWKFIDKLLGRSQVHPLKQSKNLLAFFIGIARVSVYAQRTRQVIANAMYRVQRRKRVLENVLHLSSVGSHRHMPFRYRHPLEANHAACWFMKTPQQAGNGGFAASALAHQRRRLPWIQGQRCIFYSMYSLRWTEQSYGAQWKIFPQMYSLQDRLIRRLRYLFMLKRLRCGGGSSVWPIRHCCMTRHNIPHLCIIAAHCSSSLPPP